MTLRYASCFQTFVTKDDQVQHRRATYLFICYYSDENVKQVMVYDFLISYVLLIHTAIPHSPYILWIELQHVLFALPQVFVVK